MYNFTHLTFMWTVVPRWLNVLNENAYCGCS
jgi:hypothetical protein